jgi:hypothetical protein
LKDGGLSRQREAFAEHVILPYALSPYKSQTQRFPAAQPLLTLMLLEGLLMTQTHLRRLHLHHHQFDFLHSRLVAYRSVYLLLLSMDLIPLELWIVVEELIVGFLFLHLDHRLRQQGMLIQRAMSILEGTS